IARKRPRFFSIDPRLGVAGPVHVYAGGAVPATPPARTTGWCWTPATGRHPRAVRSTRGFALQATASLRGPDNIADAEPRCTRYLQTAAAAQGGGACFHTSAELGNCTPAQAERSLCYVSANPVTEERTCIRGTGHLLPCPMGPQLEVMRRQFARPELLGLNLSAKNGKRIHEVLAYSIQRSDMDLRRCCTPILFVCRAAPRCLEDSATGFWPELKRLVPKDNRVENFCHHRSASTPLGLAAPFWQRCTRSGECVLGQQERVRRGGRAGQFTGKPSDFESEPFD
uniref:FZ domain-containing protein n=1 Tax=Macrostomum lignano TaxID=282301 RepID=A0A1I8FJ91_9PLAT